MEIFRITFENFDDQEQSVKKHAIYVSDRDLIRLLTTDELFTRTNIDVKTDESVIFGDAIRDALELDKSSVD